MLSICYFEPAFEGKILLTIGGRNHEIIQRNGNKYAASIGRVIRG